MEKKRIINDVSQAGNMFSLLKTMKPFDFKLVMRNSVEINDLVLVTQRFLEEEKTIYQQQQTKLMPLGTSHRGKLTLPRTSLISKDKNSQKFLSNQCSKSSSKIFTKQEIHGQPSKRIFGLDEAFGYAGTPIGNNDDLNKIVNKFKYEPSCETGHKISCGKPKLFEIDVNDDAQKILSLKAIFEKLNIQNSNSSNKHVILHFNTINEEIPNNLATAFEFLEIDKGKITSKYEDFINDDYNKSVLVCNYRNFRGLEHSSVIVTIDCDFYNIQHYLVEAMCRSISRLAVVVLQFSGTVLRIIEKWKDGGNGKSVIETWRTVVSTEKNTTSVEINEELKLITVYTFSKEIETVRNELQSYSHQNIIESDVGDLIQAEAEQLIQNR